VTHSAILALEDGSIFNGTSIGISGLSVGEVVFNTAMTGYQEIITDPSYAQQIITLTTPHIGNTGINSEDFESDQVWASGLVIRDLAKTVSNWRSEMSLADFLQQQEIVAIADIDTRRLTRLLRDKGTLRGCIMADDELDPQRAIELAREFPGLVGKDLAKEVTTSFNYEWLEGSWSWQSGVKTYRRDELPYHVVVVDYGVKRNILRLLVDQGCHLTVVPATTTAQEIMALGPDGVFLSNGPGDPEPCDYAIHTIKTLLSHDVPLFGICLGFQLLALACGAKTIKMKFGHHGANHPIMMTDNERVFISSQNHGFAVSDDDLPSDLHVIARSLFDNSLQGLQHRTRSAFGLQGHPEASPGPHDCRAVFKQFTAMMQEKRGVTTYATT